MLIDHPHELVGAAKRRVLAMAHNDALALTLFRNGRALSARELKVQLHIPERTARRMLSRFVQRGLIERAADGGYKLKKTEQAA